MLFSQKWDDYKPYAKYKKIANILLGSAIIAWILLFVLEVIFGLGFLDYIDIFVKCIFIIGLIIASIPDVFEKDIKSIIGDLIIILIMIFILFML